MNATETRRLIQAARTAVSLIGLVHQTMWDLFPNEMLLLQESDEQRLLDALGDALKLMPDPLPPSGQAHIA
jgi:hypothetical protein